MNYPFQQPAAYPFQQPSSEAADIGGNYTAGSYATEAEAAAAFDDAVLACGLWTVYIEVPGTLCQPRPAQSDKSLRIDRVLVPNQRLRDLGWAYGVIGVEIKKSGIGIGPPIAQAMDYSRAVWTLSQLGGTRVWLDWVFIWPMPKQSFTVASILTQNRIGSASSDIWTFLQLKSGEHNLIKVSRDGRIEIGHAIVNGRKAGSR